MPDLDRAAFAAWLRAQPPEAVVGTTWWPYHCPLANWLGDLWGEVVTVAHDGYRRNMRFSEGPEWFRHFAVAIDGPEPRKGERRRSITAAEALALLAEVPA